MELAALVMVNLVTATAMYFFFSLRFTAAVKKASKTVVLKELRENVEATVEYINTALDLMEEKNRTFYRMLRRSEELTAKLEELEQGTARSGTRKSRKKTTVPDKSPPGKKTTATTGKKVKNEPVQTGEQERDLDVGDDGAPDYLMRVLDQAGNPDRFESAEFQTREPVSSRGPASSNQPTRTKATGLLGAIGDIFVRALGGQSVGSETLLTSDKKNLPGVKKTEMVDFQTSFNQARQTVPAPEQGTKVPEKSGSRPESAKEPKDHSETSKNQDGDHFDHVVESPPPRYGTSEERIRSFLSGQADRLPEKLDGGKGSGHPVTVSGFTEDLLADLELPEPVSDSGEDERLPVTESSLLEQFRSMGPVERKGLVRELAREGASVSEISILTGLGPAEIELILLLPDDEKRPRKKRMVMES